MLEILKRVRKEMSVGRGFATLVTSSRHTADASLAVRPVGHGSSCPCLRVHLRLFYAAAPVPLESHLADARFSSLIKLRRRNFLKTLRGMYVNERMLWSGENQLAAGDYFTCNANLQVYVLLVQQRKRFAGLS